MPSTGRAFLFFLLLGRDPLHAFKKISGQLLQHVGYNTLFPYAAIMVSISFITMSLTRHGDSRPEKKGKLESFDIED